MNAGVGAPQTAQLRHAQARRRCQGPSAWLPEWTWPRAACHYSAAVAPGRMPRTRTTRVGDVQAAGSDNNNNSSSSANGSKSGSSSSSSSSGRFSGGRGSGGGSSAQGGGSGGDTPKLPAVHTHWLATAGRAAAAAAAAVGLLAGAAGGPPLAALADARAAAAVGEAAAGSVVLVGGPGERGGGGAVPESWLTVWGGGDAGGEQLVFWLGGGSGGGGGEGAAPLGQLRGTHAAARDGGGGSGGGWSEGSELASEGEDRLLEAARQVEARLEGVFGALAGGLPSLGPGSEAGAAAATAAAHDLIREVWEVVDVNYLDARSTGYNRDRWAELRDGALAVPYRDTAAAHRAVRDLLARGLSDPYCRFVSPGELDAMKKYDVSGVGLNLGTAAEYSVKTGSPLPRPESCITSGDGRGVFVVGVSRGSPADVAGVRQGDELLAVQGESLDTVSPFRASGLISGAVPGAAVADAAPTTDGGRGPGGGGGAGAAGGDLVRVKVRHTDGAEEEVAVRRPSRVLPSAVSTSLTRSPPPPLAGAGGGGGGGSELVGTVRLSAFNARAQSDVAAAISRLQAAGASRLVLDLRDNRGGLVTEGLEVASLFLEGGSPIVITERRDATPDTPTAPGPPLTRAPLLVLVNDHTASASEIVAGALRDNCRAVLAGGRTYGKGLIQSVYELSDGSGLVITVGKYSTPRGTDIDRFGIQPDFSSAPSPAQYDATIAACRLTAPPLLAAPPVSAGTAA